MPFFPASHLTPEPTLFQLLSALDSTPQKCAPRRQQFTPRFDVAETDRDYQLYGDVPGATQEDLTIEFSDAQTLVIQGKTQRLAPQAPAEPEQEIAGAEETGSEKSHSATVEDEYDEADTPLATPASSATVADAPVEKKKTPEEEAAPKAKYWVAERRVGEFARSFSFAQRVEQDGVKASLRNGVLHVLVPKNLRRGKVVVEVR